MGGIVLESQSVSRQFSTYRGYHFASKHTLTLLSDRSYLERYRSCKSAVEVSAAQEHIIQELEQDYESSRREKGRRSQSALMACV
jgi:hypothetical protein